MTTRDIILYAWIIGGIINVVYLAIKFRDKESEAYKDALKSFDEHRELLGDRAIWTILYTFSFIMSWAVLFIPLFRKKKEK